MRSMPAPSDEQPPPVHERRFLIRVGDEVPEWVIRACLHWQRKYVGSLFVSLGGGPDTLPPAERIDRLLSAGLSPGMTNFLDPGRIQALAELSEFVDHLWARTPGLSAPEPGGEEARTIAELFAVGATDTVGVPEPLAHAAHEIASCVNSQLTNDGIPCPVPAEPSSVEPLLVTPLPATRTGGRALTDVIGAGAGSETLLRESAAVVTRECEQVTDLIRWFVEHH